MYMYMWLFLCVCSYIYTFSHLFFNCTGGMCMSVPGAGTDVLGMASKATRWVSK